MIIDKLSIDIVDGCYLRCIGCPNSTIKKNVDFMTPEILINCLKNIDIKINILRLYNFGEPLLHPQLSKMVNIINQWNKANMIEISTSGQCDEKAIKQLKECNIDSLVVSCDGENKNDYERIRKGARFEKLIWFLENARKVTPYSKHIMRGIVKTKKGKKWWNGIARGWKREFRTWHPFPRSIENPSGKIADKTKGSCRYMKKDNLYINCKGYVGPCCVYPDAIYIGSLLKNEASQIIKRKRVLRKIMDYKREGVCLECAF